MRLICVSNRLPVTVVEKEGKYEVKPSMGGLVTGLSAYLDATQKKTQPKSEPYVWVGWPGIDMPKGERRKWKNITVSKFHAYPVFVEQQKMNDFYHGFCNNTIWPLFHYFTANVQFSEHTWHQYESVNLAYCNAILEILKPGDMVWVHDYHLMLLPKLIKQRSPDTAVGFFLHIPFPSYEIFRLLPRLWARSILDGMLGAGLIGFHTHDYTQHFLRSVLRILGHDHTVGQVNVDNHISHVETFPMGIDFKKYNRVALSAPAKKERKKYKQQLSKVKIVVSVDRLDYTKGILERLKAFKTFLEKYPEWHKKVVLVMIVVPSRSGVEHYQEMQRQIDELVGNINGQFGTLDWTPALYQNRFLSLPSLTAIYSLGDIALLTPIRDGMNLIAKEYMACRTEQTGVLILSEMAGAAKELGEALIVNPNSRGEIADAIKEALEMPRAEQIRRNKIMCERLNRYDVVRWADDFIQHLNQFDAKQKKHQARLLSEKNRRAMVRAFRKAKRRLIFLDYDGTLVGFHNLPELAKPSDYVLGLLKTLSTDPRNEVVIVSGRDKKALQNWFGKLPIDMIAEHGVYMRGKTGGWRFTKSISDEWKNHLRPMLELYVDRLPGSFIEEKSYSLAWHFRKTDLETGPQKAKELVDDLVNYTANLEVQVLQGKKVVEIRNAGINKGAAAMRVIAKYPHDFLLSIGDDRTDEDLFRILPKTAYSIRVGLAQSFAKYHLRNHHDVLALLNEIAKK